MKSLLEIFLYLSGAISLFFLFQLFGMFSEELSLINVSKALFPIVCTGLLYLIYLKETKQKLITPHLEEGKLLTTIEFHIEKGGDPDVFLEWVEQEKNNPKYLKPTLQ